MKTNENNNEDNISMLYKNANNKYFTMIQDMHKSQSFKIKQSPYFIVLNKNAQIIIQSLFAYSNLVIYALLHQTLFRL